MTDQPTTLAPTRRAILRGATTTAAVTAGALLWSQPTVSHATSSPAYATSNQTPKAPKCVAHGTRTMRMVKRGGRPAKVYDYYVSVACHLSNVASVVINGVKAERYLLGWRITGVEEKHDSLPVAVLVRNNSTPWAEDVEF